MAVPHRDVPSGAFVISLDFELYWGVRDKRSLESYAGRLDAVGEVIEGLLCLFERYEVHATWSTVGALFLESKSDFLETGGQVRPGYQDQNLCPYRYAEASSDLEARYHFVPDTIQRIAECPGQEVGTHTFSHFYCLEPGVTQESFAADLDLAMLVAGRLGLPPKSLVFPRNQWCQGYLNELSKRGINCFRGTENNWLYRPGPKNTQSLVRRALRLLDSYLNLTGNHTFAWPSPNRSGLIDVPASRFFRAYSPRLQFLEPLKLQRIKLGMREAARANQIFHLWWHPHNFGKCMSQNLAQVEELLEEYSRLAHSHNFRSCTMSEVAREVNCRHAQSA